MIQTTNLTSYENGKSHAHDATTHLPMSQVKASENFFTTPRSIEQDIVIRDKEDVIFFLVLIIFAFLVILFVTLSPGVINILKHPHFYLERQSTTQSQNIKAVN